MKSFKIYLFKSRLSNLFKSFNTLRSHANINFKLFKRSKCRKVWNQHKWLKCAAWNDRDIRCDVLININIEDLYIDLLNFFHELFKKVDKSLDNHTDITFNNFLMKESVIVSYHLKRSLYFFTQNNLVEKE